MFASRQTSAFNLITVSACYQEVINIMENLNATFPPITYDPVYEVFEEDEAETQQAIADTMLGIAETTFKHSGHAMRSVHAKSHGLLIGELKVLDNLPPHLAQGIFAK